MSKTRDIVPLRFFLGGREVTRANWHTFGSEVTEDRLDAVAHSIYDTVGALRCAAHGKKAVLEGRGESLSDMHFRLTTCCDTFRAEVGKALDAIRPKFRWS